jgi:hypothetical protein
MLSRINVGYGQDISTRERASVVLHTVCNIKIPTITAGFTPLSGLRKVCSGMHQHSSQHVIARRRSRRGNPEVSFFA